MSDPNEAESGSDAAAVADEENTGGSEGSASPANDRGDERVPDFDQQNPTPMNGSGKFESKRFGGVQVSLTAHLGSAKLAIQELAALSEGAVVELDREIGEPVELVAQGVPLGNGEVVVVDDRFAVRIKEIY